MSKDLFKLYAEADAEREILAQKLILAEEALEFVLERSGPNKLSESLGTLSHRVADINTKARTALEKLRGEK